MDKLIITGLLIFLPVLVALTGPFLLRPISCAPKTKLHFNISLIDLAALVWLVSFVPLLLYGMDALVSITADTSRGSLIRNFENGYWFIACMLALILCAVWASGVRHLNALEIRDWKARGGYLAISIPLAYLCPASALISLAFMKLDQQLSGFWGLLLVVFSLLLGVISQWICQLVVNTAAFHRSDAAGPDVAKPSDPFGK